MKKIIVRELDFDIIAPHKNLGCWGFILFGKYFDISLPHREGFGWTWRRLVRFYWKFKGRRHYFYLPGFCHVKAA